MLGFSNYSGAACVDKVANEYLIVTSNPDLVFDSIKNENLAFDDKTSFNFIYNHQKKNLSPLSFNESNKDLKTSTIILSLKTSEVDTLKKLKNTEVIPNCYISIEPIETQLGDLSNLDVSLQKTANLPKFDDPLAGRQWGLDFLYEGVEVDKLNPSSSVVVAISDTGFDINHEDLKNKLWVNSTELNGLEGVDDDGNGCVDDIHGCDVTDKDGDVGLNYYNSSLTDHGSHVAGIAGAETNNLIGVAGASLNVKLMLVKSFSSSRRTTTADLLRSIYYSVDSGAEIINCSWGTGALPTIAEFNAFEYARINDVLVVVAAGNSSIYASKTSPGGLTNVLTVGSFNSDYQLSTFSNFGKSVDILAPGGDGNQRKNDFILSLASESKYTEKKGTSMAAPFVAAALANLKSLYPALKRAELLNLLLLSSDKREIFSYFDSEYSDSGNFLNLGEAISMAEEYSVSTLAKSLNFEPKLVVKPSSSLNPYSGELGLTESKESSGCSHSMESKNADISFVLFLLVPLFLILKNRKRFK